VTKIFPAAMKNQTINDNHFISQMKQQDYIFVNSEAIRKDYTNYVLVQRQNIIDNVHKGAANESFNASQSQNNTYTADG